MKNVVSLFVFLAFFSTSMSAQKVIPLDKSQMDMSYFPFNFAHDRKPGDKAIIRVIYSRPGKKEREIFGKLIPFDKVWRAGANESTEIKFYQDVTIQGKQIKAGSYALFTIPNENEWTIILNSDLDFWGAFSYKEADDVFRFKVPVKKAESMAENFTIEFKKTDDNNAVMQLVWDTTLVELPISIH